MKILKNRKWNQWISWCLILAFLFINSTTVTWAAEADGGFVQEQNNQQDVEQEAGQLTDDTEQETEEKNEIPVSDIELSDYEEELEVGNTLSLSATVLPSDATDSTVTYKSSDESIATVKSTGEVKGISKGNVIIYVTAGEVTKEVALTVKVATTGITVNKDYLVLKQGDTFQLSATATPAEASQSVTYKVVDESVAVVSSTGAVTAKKVGSTTIVVSNGESSNAVSVIVNQETVDTNEDNQLGLSSSGVKEYAECVNASETEKIDSENLYYFYSTEKTLEIVGDGYRIEIDGKDIVNYKNEFYTDINLTSEEEGISFNLNQGEFLCGAVRLYLDDVEGKYLYLYNSSKDKYVLLNSDNMQELELTTPGEYRITSQKMVEDTTVLIVIVAVGTVAILIGVGVYIGVKKKYWFW